MYPIILGLIFLSGCAGLVYEVLWMKQLGLLFGNSAQASAATFSAFFLGLGVGNWFWGRRAERMQDLLRAYALLEAGILACALIYFLILKLFHFTYPSLFQFAAQAHVVVIVKFLLAVLLVFPAAFFMGGTLPVMGQFLVRRKHEFGRTVSLFYGINTLGAAAGALAAGFYLPLQFGYRSSYLIGLAITGTVAAAAFFLSFRAKKRGIGHGPEATEPPSRDTADPGLPLPVITALCFLSGFGTLALEVLWTQMLSHSLQNTVYTFAAVLVTTLVCLAMGAGVAHILARQRWRPVRIIFILLTMAGLSTGLSSFLMTGLTDNLSIVNPGNEWGGHLFKVFRLTFLVAGMPLFFLGTIFPYLLKTGERYVESAGRTLGDLSAANTAGAVLGSSVAGFFLLGWLGLWHAVQLMSIAYLLAAILLPVPFKSLKPLWRAGAVVILLLHLNPLNPHHLLNMRMEPDEAMLEYWHGATGTVAVVKKGDNKTIKINGHYSLGSLQADYLEKGQARIPLLLHPRAESVFFLGLGTGITAAEALCPEYGLERVVSCELIPEVVTAARTHFSEYTKDLFTDPRSRVIVDDGRHYLKATGEKFDIVNSDLFVVYRRGAGSLYSLEHFQSASERLAPGGLFVQWIPIYQLTRREFFIIAKTMLDVFPQVTVWRNDFNTWETAIALVAQNDTSPLFPTGYAGFSPQLRTAALAGIDVRRFRSDETTLLLCYCGNLSGARAMFADIPRNTDDHPLIEYMTPRSSHAQAGGNAVWFAGPHFVGFMEELLMLTPPERDAALANLKEEERQAARAGYHLARAHLFRGAFEKGIPGADRSWLGIAEESMKEFIKCWTGAEPRAMDSTEH